MISTVRGVLTRSIRRFPALVRFSSSDEAVVRERRAAMFGRIFMGGVPKIWCQPLVHVKEDGSLDIPRITAHFNSIYPFVRGYYLPFACREDLIDGRPFFQAIVELTSSEPNLHVIAGANAEDLTESCDLVMDTFQWMKSRVSPNMPTEFALKAHTIAGFAITPPYSIGQMSEQELIQGFEDIFAMDLPIAIVQPPPPAVNQLSFGAYSTLARTYSNFLFLLDRSGSDAIACQLENHGQSIEEETRVKLLQGVDSDYDVWLNPSGPYSGMVLHTANCFAPQMNFILDRLRNNDLKEANTYSHKISKVDNHAAAVSHMFQVINGVLALLVDTHLGLGTGHFEAAAMTVIDQVMAYGPTESLSAPEPRLWNGTTIPKTV